MTIGQAQDLLDILEDRSGSASTLIATQVPIASRHGRIGDPTSADAILDRLLHHSHVLNVRGDSYRLREKRRAGLPASPRAAEDTASQEQGR